MPTKQSPDTEDHSQSPEVPRVYLVAMLGALALLILTITITFSVRQRRMSRSPGDASRVERMADASPAATTPTSSPTELSAAEAIALPQVTQDVSLPKPTPTDLSAELALPTVTPTPELPPPAPREVEVSGSTTMRLALSGEGFDSTGRPLSFEIEPRKAILGGDIETVTDAWCIQLGLVNETFDLTVGIDPATEELSVGGTISLRAGFCEQPGAIMDSVDVDLAVPTDAAAQISYNLRGKRSLFDLEGLLDSDTGAIVELRVTNTRPQ